MFDLNTANCSFQLIMLTLPVYVTFELREVEALFNKDSRSLSSTGTAIFCNISTPFSHATPNASDMFIGWIPILSYC